MEGEAGGSVSVGRVQRYRIFDNMLAAGALELLLILLTKPDWMCMNSVHVM